SDLLAALFHNGASAPTGGLMAVTNGKTRDKQPVYGIVDASIRDNGTLLLITVDLTGQAQPSASGKSDMLASSRGTVKVEHPEIPGLWYAVNVGFESEQYAMLKAELRAARNAIKAL